MGITQASRSPLFAVLGSAMLFGTTGTALAKGPHGVTPLGAGVWRLLIGGAVLCVLAVPELRTKTSPRQMWPSLLVGGGAVAVFQLCYFWATRRTGVALATVVAIGSGPFFAVALESVRHRRLPPGAWLIGTAFGVAGVALLGLAGQQAAVRWSGVGAAAAAGFGWAVFATLSKHQIEHGVGSTASLAGMFCAGAALVSPLLLVEPMGWMLTAGGVALVAYLGAVTLGLAYWLYGYGLRHFAAPTVITFTLAEPVTAAVLAVAVVGEHLTVAGWAGIALVLAGLVVTAGADHS